MPIEYSMAAKNARLEVIRVALNGGILEIGTAGMARRLAAIELDSASGSVLAASLIFNGFPKFAMSEAKGRAAAAQLKNKLGAIVASGLTVGTQDADIVMGNVEIDAANVVKIERAEIRHG